MFPERLMEGSAKERRRFSCSFQHEAPVSLQMKEAEVLVKDHAESLSSGSEREDLMPSRHLTSSSIEIEGLVRRKKREMVRNGWRFMVILAGGFGGFC